MVRENLKNFGKNFINSRKLQTRKVTKYEPKSVDDKLETIFQISKGNVQERRKVKLYNKTALRNLS